VRIEADLVPHATAEAVEVLVNEFGVREDESGLRMIA
jgi:hypothetical protein